MQQPTCLSIRIRSTTDAHKIFGAVQQGVLHMVTRRLDADERLALRSGCVYAWEERGPHSELTGLGIERFTEGRRWSPSRVRDEFLFYYEKYSPPPDAQANHPGQPPRDWDPLVKQTYSVWVQTEKGRRKWHLTAYFTQATIDQLGTIDDNPRIRDIVVPDGMFKSTRVGKGRAKPDDSNRTDAARAATTVPRTYAAFPAPYQYQAQNGSPSMTPVLMHEPYQNRPSEHLPSPSPVSPHSNPSFVPNQAPYSGSSDSTSSSSYMSPQYAATPPPVPRSMASSNYQLSPLPRSQLPQNQNYYPSVASSSSWDGNNNFYSRSEAHSADSNTKYASYPSSMPPNTGREPPQRPSSSPQGYNSPLAPSQGANPIYSPSYSLQSALTLPSFPRDSADLRGPILSPLQIPDRLQAGLHPPQPVYGQGSPSSMSMQTAGPEPEYALAPLTLPRPAQVKYVRYSEDEKSLRLLRDEQTSRYLREEAKGSNS